MIRRLISVVLVPVWILLVGTMFVLLLIDAIEYVFTGKCEAVNAIHDFIFEPFGIKAEQFYWLK